MKKQQYFALTGLMPQGAFNFKLDHPLTSNGKTRLYILKTEIILVVLCTRKLV
jgi:hypothetical protein